MLQIITLMILTYGQRIYVDQTIPDKNFTLIEDFDKNQKSFQADTFDLLNQSTDGGQLIAYFNKDKDYLVFDIWLFGETGKIHATYWTDKELRFKIVKRTDFKYDKPYYEKGFKTTQKTEYLSYVDNLVKRYSSDKKELKDSITSEKRIESENFFNAVTKDWKIVK